MTETASFDNTLFLFNELNPSIVRLEIETPQFKLKPIMFQMLQTVGQFNGMPTKDPHLHLRLLMKVSDSFNWSELQRMPWDWNCFHTFSEIKARAWRNSLPSNFVTTWKELVELFLMKYFPPTKNVKLRWNHFISTTWKIFLYEAWERFKELLQKCPHHGIPHCIQMETFYKGLNAHTIMVVDASTNEVLLAKSYNEAYEILKRISNNNY